MRCWIDNELFKEVLAFLLMNDIDWEVMSAVENKGFLAGMANMTDTISIELGILSTYLRQRTNQDTHEHAMQVARRDMRRKLGAG